MIQNILDKKELDTLDQLEKRYIKLTTPNELVKLGEKGLSLIPKEIKAVVSSIGHTISEQELFTQAMKLISTGFGTVLEQAAKVTIDKPAIVKELNKVSRVASYDDIPKMRSYEIAKVVNNKKLGDLFLAFTEGAGTGFAGFAGLPFNLVLSNLLYFRAVQSVAMYYGYDVKHDSSELAIANTVFLQALSPRNSVTSNELSSFVTKMMLISKATIVGQTAKKGWAEMANKGGVNLLLTQMRALAHGSAKKALEKAGQKGLENTLFKETFELIGKKLTQQAISRSIPFISAGVSALIDTAQMNQILEYADVFYQKRFILEKELRLQQLEKMECDIIEDANFTEI